MHRYLVYALLSCAACGVLAGCGQKGPLVLPTKPATASTTPPAPAASVARPADAITPPPASATRGS